MDAGDDHRTVYENLKKVFQQVDPDVLKLIAREHSDDMDAATTAVVDNIEYYQLLLIFPLVDVEILNFFASEYRNNLETAIKIILDEVLFYIPSYQNNNNNQNHHDDQNVALLMDSLKTQLFNYSFEKMGDDCDDYVFTRLSELFPQVDHRILKAVSFNHEYNLDAAVDVIMDNFVFEQLKDVFPLVGDEILKAIADEHSDNVDVAINVILHEVVPYLPTYIGGSDGPEIDQEEFSFDAANTLTGDSFTFRGLSADVLESAVQSEADEMKQVKQLSTPEEAKLGEDSAYFDDPTSSDSETSNSSGSSEHTLLEYSSVSRSLGITEEPALDDYVSVCREIFEKLEPMTEGATQNKGLCNAQEEEPLVEFQKDGEQDGEEGEDIDSQAVVKQDISEELFNVSKVLQEEVQEHSRMRNGIFSPEESEEKLDGWELLSQHPAFSNKSRKLASLSSSQDGKASDKVLEEIETSSSEGGSPIGGTEEDVVNDDDHQQLHEDDWEFIGHSDAE